MEKVIKESMSEAILKKTNNFYDFDSKELEDLGGFENFVYGFKDFVIRFVHSKHRTYQQVLAEIEFIDYLSNQGASVSTIVHSKLGNICEKIMITDIDYFTVTLFTKAPGTFVNKEEMNEAFFYRLGKEIGLLHHLTKTYETTNSRIHWNQEDYIEVYGKYVDKDDNIILEKSKDIVKKISLISKNNDNYGLIHTDLHFGNMYQNQKQLTFFDFDDCAYHYFISDIAIVLYYYFTFTDRKANRVEKTKVILSSLLKGYKEENNISKDTLYHLNDFLKLRETILYLVLLGDVKLINSSDSMKQFIEKLRFNILNDIPFYADIDGLLKTII